VAAKALETHNDTSSASTPNLIFVRPSSRSNQGSWEISLRRQQGLHPREMQDNHDVLCRILPGPGGEFAARGSTVTEVLKLFTPPLYSPPHFLQVYQFVWTLDPSVCEQSVTSSSAWTKLVDRSRGFRLGLLAPKGSPFRYVFV
jgi:hypothetical protein